MWKVKKIEFNYGCVYVLDDGDKLLRDEDCNLWVTPYQSEAQELADKLNGDSDA